MDGDYNDKTNYLFLSEKQNQKKKKNGGRGWELKILFLISFVLCLV